MKIDIHAPTWLQKQLLDDLVIELAGTCDNLRNVNLNGTIFYYQLPWQEQFVPELRRLGWSVYWWTTRDCSGPPQIFIPASNTKIYPQGLIFGRHCARLIAWRMANDDFV